MSIDCNYWTDNQLPLSYEMALLHDAAPRILCDSFNETCRANFPDGYKDNTTLKIRIRIYDSLKMYSELTKDIKVSEKNSSLYCKLTLLYLTLPDFTLPYFTLPYLTLPYLTLRYLTLPYIALPYLTSPHLTFPYPTQPYLTLLYPS